MNDKGIKSFSLGKDLAKWVDEYASEQRVSSSYVVREVLYWLKRRATKVPVSNSQHS